MADNFTQTWHANRAYLVNVAYRILGDIGEAEDVVQEAFLRRALMPPGEIQDDRGWLTVATSRLCLDLVRSARSRHERLPGVDVVDALAPFASDPADRVTLDDEVRGALRVVMERLSPAERVAFVLHDVFRTPFDDIAVTLGKSAATCRQLAKRARQKIAEPPALSADVAPSEHQKVTEQFITACSNGDLTTLLDVLAPTVWGVADLLGSGRDPIVTNGPEEVAANLLRYYGNDVTIVTHPGKSQTLLAFNKHVLFATITLTIDESLIGKIEVILDTGSAPAIAPP